MTELVNKRVTMNRALTEYMLAQAEPPISSQQWLIDATAALGASAEMQIPHEQAVLLSFLADIANAVTIVEVGTFTGYSTLALALGLKAGGVVHTYDISSEWSGIASKAWADAGVADRIKRYTGPALDGLAALPAGQFVDMAFIDADKAGYVDYWNELVPRIRSGGLILADNVLYSGEVVSAAPSHNALAIVEFNAHVRADDRVESVLLPISDGLTIARKK
ncbi:O-methyltransferase [Amycolatopsis sp. H20-H5]|uniref:O-methyltransferase n=1 Tax=Amycolatopsis sp. H20-H5 TaxID=3046309 RepID=UPI002DB647B6|nr:O-methyltransferase [Amycolatopsis sp. H20-H5]MEC3975554.1 O-methyltransferase [Amycolatopsis sp. H20-H5]